MHNHSRLNTWALGFSIGTLWGVSILLIGLLATYLGIGAGFVSIFGEFYRGFELGLLGSIIGSIWGFADGFIGGFLIAWLYNMFDTCCNKHE